MIPTLKRLGEIKDGAKLRLTLYPWAYLWRRLARRTRFIAVTGSLGKTTTKELIAGCLATHGSTTKSFSNRNGHIDMARNVLRVRPGHRFAVLETGVMEKGDLARTGRFLRPDIAVVLAVVMEHRSAFRNLEAIAEEKGQLPLSVRTGGSVWLNGDDPHVAPMPVPKGVRRSLFGTKPEFDLWASDVTSCWPGQLRFTAHYRGESEQVSVQLLGVHWLPAALAALGVSIDCGMTLKCAAAELAKVPPMPGRMQPVELSNGAVVLRDDYKGGRDSFLEALKVLRDAPVPVRWLVTSGYDETSHSPDYRMKVLAREVQGVANRVLFIGPHASIGAAKAVTDGMPKEHVFQALNVPLAGRLLQSEMRPGDLILLKGLHADHLARIFFLIAEDRYGKMSCARIDCSRRIICDECPELHEHRAPLLQDISLRPAQRHVVDNVSTG